MNRPRFSAHELRNQSLDQSRDLVLENGEVDSSRPGQRGRSAQESKQPMRRSVALTLAVFTVIAVNGCGKHAERQANSGAAAASGQKDAVSEAEAPSPAVPPPATAGQKEPFSRAETTVKELLVKYVKHADALHAQERNQEALCAYKNALTFAPGDKELQEKINGILSTEGERFDYTSPEYQRFFNDVLPKLDFKRDLGNWPRVDGQHDSTELRILMAKEAVGEGMFAPSQVTGGDPNVPIVFFVRKPVLTATDLVNRFGEPEQDRVFWDGGLRALTYGRMRFLIDGKGNTVALFRRIKVKE